VLDDIARGRTVSICGVCSYPAPGRRVAAKADPVYGRRAPLSTRPMGACDEKTHLVIARKRVPPITVITGSWHMLLPPSPWSRTVSEAEC
jgi:hypothetical protein